MLIPVIFLICCLGALGFEVLRFRTRPEAWVRTELTILGFALTILTGFLGWRIFHSGRIPLSSPQDAILVLIWVLTGIAMGLISTWRRKSFGLGLLPMILLLLLAVFGADDTPYAARPASAVWGGVHGGSMLLAAVSIFFGCLSGMMFLRQAWALKHPSFASSRKGWIHPSLEWLHAANQHSMKLATVMLALGVLSGIVMDLLRHDSVNLLANWMILGTMGLLFWFVLSLVLGFFWTRANAGPQIAFRTILNFAALCTLFGLVIFSQHRNFSEKQEFPSVPPETVSEENLEMDFETTGRFPEVEVLP
ncbi:MAG: hypothetical protein E7028_02420 [Planctomycetaceae bacterium]|nr:hypothetical protein [Planctomycetaceae bacterium]MBQ2820993.1 hypothetical protein [Thermoguttaceae bacterium]